MAETKAKKQEILAFIDARETITSYQLMERFGYTYSYSCKKLSLLKKQGLIVDLGSTPSSHRGQWCLTDKGYNRLHYLLKQQEEETKRSKERDEELVAQGYKDARRRYNVSYSCCICGKEVEVNADEERKAIRQYMESQKWGHAECLGGGKGQKISLNAVRERVSRLAVEICSLTRIYATAQKNGIRPEQIDWRDWTSRKEEMEKLLPLLPINEQKDMLKKAFPNLLGKPSH